MQETLLSILHRINPWIETPSKISELIEPGYLTRSQTTQLLSPDWDKICLVLLGPRQAGKTTLGKHIAYEIICQNRFQSLLYLNCDFIEIRDWLRDSNFIEEAHKTFNLKKPIIFIDEVQRLENPGLLLKSIVDSKLPIKLMASGSSCLEIKSKIQEFLTGRHLEALILPLSYQEIGLFSEERIIYGCYPSVVLSTQKRIVLQQLFSDYIKKDIIEILKVGKPDVIQKLIALIANSSGQLVNYNQFATDCRVSVPTIQHYCTLLEQTYTIYRIQPFVGNKRQEIISNPVYYFIDNGFRNQALRRFTALDAREDVGLLIQNAVFQEIIKYHSQYFYDFDIHYWRTKSGAEVDFVLHWNADTVIPIEAKYRNIKKSTIPRALRSFIEAYQPKVAFMITKNYMAEAIHENCIVHFIPMLKLHKMFELIKTTT